MHRPIAVMGAAVAFLAAGCSGSNHAAQLHRRYFLIGKRECTKLYRLGRFQPTNLGNVSQWYGGANGMQVAVGMKGIPKTYQHDVPAGCDAAS